MVRQLSLSFNHQLSYATPYSERTSRRCIPWIESPVNLKHGPHHPRLYQHSDATPIELFFDLFFVANLAVFTSIHQINNLEALFSYIGFFSVIWFTWLQVTLHDIRFARDSILERIFKAMQLATMVGFASTGPSFSTRIRFENVWAFRSLSSLLAMSRLLLSLQYVIASIFLMKPMRTAWKKVLSISAIYFCMSAMYLGLYFAMRQETSKGSYVWTAWLVLFVVETVGVFWLSYRTEGIALEDTHLNVRMGLLTLIIIGEGVISITKLVNRIVGTTGWNSWSLVHIFGVSTAVYLLWQSYFDLSPRHRFGKISQLVWVALHFPLHVTLILLSEGSEILALTLDIFQKLRILGNMLMTLCDASQREWPDLAIDRLNKTIEGMGIDFRHSTLGEQQAIQHIILDLRQSVPLCDARTTLGALTPRRSHDLMGNITTSLFASMDITLPKADSVASDQLLMRYLDLLGFVYLYFFVVAALSMLLFATFIFLTHQHVSDVHRNISMGYRLIMAAFLLSLTAVTTNYRAAYKFMTNPMIVFTYTLVLFFGLLIDRVLDSLVTKHKLPTVKKKRLPNSFVVSAEDEMASIDTGRTLVVLPPAPCSSSDTPSAEPSPC